jgi:nuclear transport factor 2 (NTF2) superfamily protein
VNELHALKNKIAVVGVGNTAYGDFPLISDYGLGAQAFKSAISDCGLNKDEIDGLLVCRVPSYARMGEVLGLNPRWTMTLPGHGRMSGMSIIEAMLALETGAAKYVALIDTNIGRSRRVNYGGEDASSFWNPWGFTSPGAAHAMMFRMHMAKYGTTTRQLSEVSVAFRKHALLNPTAVMKKPITSDDHASARRITEPLGLLDYCLIKELWAFTGNRIAVRFAYESHDDSGQWFRSYGNENWEFNAQGFMARRFASINDLPIREADRKFHWPLGRRPDDHASLSDLGL